MAERLHRLGVNTGGLKAAGLQPGGGLQLIAVPKPGAPVI